jgi:hypothetical protein
MQNDGEPERPQSATGAKEVSQSEKGSRPSSRTDQNSTEKNNVDAENKTSRPSSSSCFHQCYQVAAPRYH